MSTDDRGPRLLDAAGAADLAAAALGAPVTATQTVSGGDHSSWWIGTRHVLRWAPTRATSERLVREVALRGRLQGLLAVAVPRSVATGTWQDRTWTLDQRLAGGTAEDDVVSAAGLADLSALLRDLTTADTSPLSDLSLQTSELPDLDTLVEHAARAARALEDPTRADWLERQDLVALTRENRRRPPVLLHGDLKGEHVLLDAAGRVSGVLDWSDASVGPAAADVEGLALTVPADAAARAALDAGLPVAVVELGVLLARCRTLLRFEAVHLRGERAGPEPLLLRQLQRAWGGGRP